MLTIPKLIKRLERLENALRTNGFSLKQPAECKHGVQDNACISCYMDKTDQTPAEPMKEPVAYDVIDKCISLIGTEMVECKEASDTWFLCQRLIHAMRDMQYELKNAAPVDAKAIRAEALEEAAKVAAGYNAGRYVCECEGWSPDEVVKYPGCDYCNDELFSGRKCKCCGKVFIENVEQEIDDLRQQNAALKAVVDAWNNVEPVKQEPVGYWDGKETAFFEHELCGLKAPVEFHIPLYAAPVQPVKQEPVAFYIVLDGKPEGTEPTFDREEAEAQLTEMIDRCSIGELYAAPVDAKAIRAEALEEAAKWCDDYAAECAANENWEAEDVSLINAAAIRGLK